MLDRFYMSNQDICKFLNFVVGKYLEALLNNMVTVLIFYELQALTVDLIHELLLLLSLCGNVFYCFLDHPTPKRMQR